MWLNLLIICLSLICLIEPSSQQDKHEFLLVANGTSIFRFDEYTWNSTLITYLPPDNEVKNFDYSYKDRLLFWISSLDSSVNAVHIENGKRRTNLFRNQIASPEQLSIDWVTRKIYYIARAPDRIEVADYTGTNNTLIRLLPGQTPVCIAVAPLRGLLFWSDDEHGTIERISMNGDESTYRLVVANTTVVSLAVDHNLERIYWSDIAEGRIWSTNFDGESHRKIFAVKTPTLTFFNGNVYYLDVSEKRICSVDVIEGTKRMQLIESNEQSTQFRYFGSRNQPNRSSICQLSNGGCSYLCLLSSEQPFYSCACPTGIQLSEDQKTCKSFPDDFILIAFQKQIDYISLDTKHFQSAPTKIRNQMSIRSIDFDPVEQRLYWADQHKVKSALLDGTDERVLTECDQEYERIKIDAINRNIYLVKNLRKPVDSSTHPSNFSIEVVSLSGKYKKTLIDDFIGRPRAIAVDPENRFFYWSDWSKEQPKIERVSFDLATRQYIVTANISWPNGIVIDRELGRLYWCDAKPDKYWIEYSDLDGSNRQTLVKLDRPLLDLSLLDDYVYWVDVMRDQIGRAHKLTGQYEIISNKKLEKIFGFNVISKLSAPTPDQWKAERRNCSQLSLAHDLCACSDGYRLESDNVTCSLGANNTCAITNGGCDHECHQIVGSYTKCSCQVGFILSIDQKRCLRKSLLELKSNCKIKNPCTHGCIEMLGRYHCTCPTGMFLHPNGYRCLAEFVGTGERSPENTPHSDQSDRNATLSDNLFGKDDRQASVMSIVILALFLVSIAGISFLIINYLIKRRKEARLKESKENMIKDGKRKMDFGHSLSNMASSIGHDRSITGSSAQLDENQSLIGADPPPSAILNPYQYQYNSNTQQFVLNDSNNYLPAAASRQAEFGFDNEDTSTLSGAVIGESVYLCAPPPTPSNMSVKTEIFRNHFAGPSNSPRNYRPNDRCRSPATTISTHHYQLGNPPNSPLNSVHDLNKLDDF